MENTNCIVLPKQVTRFNEDKYLITVEFVPTISHCSLATLIGLCIRVKLTRALPFPFKADIHLAPGSHDTEQEGMFIRNEF